MKLEELREKYLGAGAGRLGARKLVAERSGGGKMGEEKEEKENARATRNERRNEDKMEVQLGEKEILF